MNLMLGLGLGLTNQKTMQGFYVWVANINGSCIDSEQKMIDMCVFNMCM